MDVKRREFLKTAVSAMAMFPVIAVLSSTAVSETILPSKKISLSHFLSKDAVEDCLIPEDLLEPEEFKQAMEFALSKEKIILTQKQVMQMAHTLGCKL